MIPNVAIDLNEKNVEALISVLGVGEANAIPSSKIQSALGLGAQQTSETARALILYAIEEHHYAIASNSKGYWLVESVGELHAYLNSLENRIRGIRKRQEAVRNAWNIRNSEGA